MSSSGEETPGPTGSFGEGACSSVSTCAWSRESWNLSVQRPSTLQAAGDRASSRSMRPFNRVACICPQPAAEPPRREGRALGSGSRAQPGA